jgi:DNA polymerase I
MRVLTGDRPTGVLHIGHYFASLRNRVALQRRGADVLVLVPDYQVLTDRDTADHLREYVESAVLDYLAIGLDPERTTIFAHSAVPALNQLLLPFLSLVTVPELNRNPTVKDEIAHSRQASVSGLMLTYPVHQAADILFCKADTVPVGKDQLPHLEITRVIARRFNDRYGPVFPVPAAMLSNAPLLLGTDGQKMSKSRDNSLPLCASPDETARLIRGAKTDSRREISYDPAGRPEVSNLVLLAALCLDRDPREVAASVHGAVALKELLTTAVNDLLAPIRRRRAEYASDPGLTGEVLKRGNERANQIARETLDEVRAAMGMCYLSWFVAEHIGVAGLTAWLRAAGVSRGGFAGLAVAPGGPTLGRPTPGGPTPGGPTPSEPTLGVAVADGCWTAAAPGSLAELAEADAEVRPRWVTWSPETAVTCVATGIRLATCWDIAAVHRMLFGGWRADPGCAWARLHDLPVPAAQTGPPDLFALTGEPGSGTHDDADDPVGPDRQLRPSWLAGGWSESEARLGRWAALALSVATAQQARLADAVSGHPMAPAICQSESAAELLCAELAAEGLPVNRAVAEGLLAGIIGTRADALRHRADRDANVLRHAPAGARADLRSPAQVLSLLRAAGLDLPDTRAWRLRELRDKHPLVDALLQWRKAERIATTYGYPWLDEHLGPDGRLRGAWTGCDGAAGRMTASAGLHNMPSVLRGAVVAEPGHVFVRADLGQIEPRVLAAVSGDAALAAATQSDDLYAPVAAALGVDRPTAKVAVLGAMYGQTTGHGAVALRRLKAAYPVAMAYLDAGDRAAQAGRDLRTYGGRLVQMQSAAGESPARVAARGRYGRNALIQGAAAEFFKMWAVTVRARAAALDARIVLCLHDELLVHAPAQAGYAVAELVDECLQETARRWAPGPAGAVRFISDTSVVSGWADAKN